MVDTRFSARTARRTLVWTALFPAAFYHLAGYSESLFLLLALLTISAAEAKKWWLAGASLYLATLTRWAGIVLTVPLLWEVLSSVGWTWRPFRPKQWYRRLGQLPSGALALAAGPLAVGSHLIYLSIAGVMLPLDAYPQLWHSKIALPWVSIAKAIPFLSGADAHPTEAMGLVMLALFLALTILAIGELRASWWLFALASQLFFLSRVQDLRPLEGTLRYLAVLFPIFVILALRVRNRWVRAGLQVASGLLQLLLLAVFIRWRWVA
jgi:hypothetical protein